MRQSAIIHNERGQRIALRLRSQRDEILRIWEMRVRSELTAPKTQSHPHLIDSLPAFLDCLADHLSGTNQIVEESSSQVAKAHAIQRSELPNYPLEEVLSEYRILRQVVLEVLEARQLLHRNEKNLILDFILQGIIAAASEYSRINLEREKAALELRTRTETKLAYTEEKVRRLMDSNIVGILFSDLQGNIRDCNAAFSELVGYSREELLSIPGIWKKITPPDVLEKEEAQLQKIVEDGVSDVYEKEYIHKDGHRVPILLGAVAVDSQRVECVCFVLDISDRKRIEEQLEAEEKRFKTIANHIPAIVWESDPQGYQTYISESGLKWFGMTLDEVMRQGWISFLHPDDVLNIQRMWCRALQSESNYEAENRLRRYDGVYEWHLTRAFPIRDEYEHVVRWIGISMNIEGQRQILSKLQYERDLREQFVATLSHDLKSPLSAARLTAQLMARKLNRPEALPTLLGRILENITRADRMIEDLLDAGRIRAGQTLPIQVHDCNLFEIASHVTENLMTIHGSRVLLKGNSHTVGQWDSEGLQRVIENLVQNGLKYGSQERPVVVEVLDRGDFAEIHVHNEGHPLSSEEVASLFQPFQRARSADKSGKKGWGLGLTLVRGMVQAHHGSVRVESSPEKGTTFIVSLPKLVKAAA